VMNTTMAMRSLFVVRAGSAAGIKDNRSERSTAVKAGRKRPHTARNRSRSVGF
jgi:hypothetical protein